MTLYSIHLQKKDGEVLKTHAVTGNDIKDFFPDSRFFDEGYMKIVDIVSGEEVEFNEIINE